MPMGKNPRQSDLRNVLADTREPGEPAKTLIDSTSRRLRRDIVHGRLAPGSKLLIEQLRADYGVSSSTLREALGLLIADVLVTAEGQRGFRVAPVSLEDFREITDLRKSMETMALRDAIKHGDAAWEAGVIAAFEALDAIDEESVQRSEAAASAWSDRNTEFHEALVAACRLRWARHFRRILHHNSHRYRQARDGLGLRAGIAAEHRAIMAAVLTRDVELACFLSERHIERTFTGMQALPFWQAPQ